MVDFLTSCTCCGRRPRALGNQSRHPRNNPLASLIKNRHLLRFLIAPGLFGKTSVVAEYAESVFSFENVYWLEGSSPCFLRDLDQGVIASRLIDDNPKRGLVVIEDMPLLDSERAKFASQLFERLIECGWELIVTMVPSCDVFDSYPHEVMRLGGEELLLTDCEIDTYRSKVERSQNLSCDFRPIDRIPGIFWQQDDNCETLLKNIAYEELSKSAQLTLFLTLVLRKGTYEDLTVFVKEKLFNSSEKLLRTYVYLGMDSCQSRFSTYSFPLESIMETFLPYLEHLSSCSNFKGRMGLIVRLADVLLGRGEPERACALIARMGTPLQRAAWLDARADHLYQEACLLPAHRLFDGLNLAKTNYRHRLLLAESKRMLVLGQQEKALEYALRVFRAKRVADESAVEAALMVYRLGDTAQILRSRTFLEAWSSCLPHMIESYNNQAFLSLLMANSLAWQAPAFAEFILSDSPEDILRFMGHCQKANLPQKQVTTIFARIFEVLKKHNTGFSEAATAQLMKSTVAHLESCRNALSLGLPEAELITEVALLQNRCSLETFESCSSELKEFGQGQEVKLFSQQASLVRLLEAESLREADYRQTHPDEFRVDPRSEANNSLGHVPPLLVRLLGGLEVKIGSSDLDSARFSRQKVKALLAILVMNPGREISRDRLTQILWPDSTAEAANRNLHSIWSLLRKALQLPDGRCPYLVRTQFSYKIESAYVSSDVAEFEDLCRHLLFGQPDIAEWTRVYTRISDLYGGDLLPTETDIEVIVKARNDYRSRLVDSFAMAALRLCEIEEYQMALWFAQEALCHESTREDAYTLLMQAQFALGQRTAALETYFKCRHYLSEELGIDSGKRTRRLYQEIVSGEVESVTPLIEA